MLDKLKNIWNLGKYKVEESSEGVKLTSTQIQKPIGKAVVVELEDEQAKLFEND